MRRSTPLVMISAAALAAVALAAPASAGGRPFETTLLGANEVGTTGDSDGSGSAEITINRGKSEICYSITVTGVAPITAGHIHEAPVDDSGPVVVSLLPMGTMLSEGTAQGCVTVDRELAKEISKDPSGYYVNVHNAEFPAGALRGQL